MSVQINADASCGICNQFLHLISDEAYSYGICDECHKDFIDDIKKLEQRFSANPKLSFFQRLGLSPIEKVAYRSVQIKSELNKAQKKAQKKREEFVKKQKEMLNEI